MSGGDRRHRDAPAWHGESDYDEREVLRIEAACRAIREHASAVAATRRYRLLDVGCGVGPLCRWLPAEAFEIVGLELSEAAAAIAATHYDACHVADLTEPWPVEAGSFDAVHAGAILEHVSDWHVILNRANTALTDAGLLVVSVPNLRYWKEIRRLLTGRQPHWLREMGHVHGFTPRFLRELVALHGFEVTALEADRVNLPLLVGPLEPWARRRLAGLGSVMILHARLTRRVRVEDRSLAHLFPDHKSLGLRAIEVGPKCEQYGNDAAAMSDME